jgi:hypothetical protein
MKWKTWTTTILFVLLLGGCDIPEYCDLVKVHPFGSAATIQYLQENDRLLLEDTVTHNTKVETFCS